MGADYNPAPGKPGPGFEADYSLAAVRAICANKGCTLEALIETLNDLRQNAERIDHEGVPHPDDSLRLKATEALLALLQMPTILKAAALKETKTGKLLEVADLIEKKKQETLEAKDAQEKHPD